MRVAANMVISGAIRHMSRCENVSNLKIEDDEDKALKLLKDFDFETFIESHDLLVASSGVEFEVDLSAMSLSEQKKHLKKTLELMEGLGDLANDLIEDRDLVDEGKGKELSAREKIMLRRKSKSMVGATATRIDNKNANLAKLELVESELFMAAASGDSTLRTVLALRSNVLNANWTVRHGALLGIKSLLRETWPQLLLAVLSRDALAVLGLDRFGDFVGDQTVAPVRETAAQTLAAIFAMMNGSGAMKRIIWEAALGMAQYDADWQVRHSGLLCIKYLSAIDEDSISNADKSTFETLINLGLKGCSDADEDIRSLSAELLGRLLATKRGRSVDNEAIYGCVVSILQDVDDDSSIAASTLVHSLALLSYIPSTILDRTRIFLLAMRMRHPMSAVREKVLDVMKGSLEGLELADIIVLLRLVVQNIILDDVNVIREKSFEIAEILISRITSDQKLLPTYVALCSILLLPRERPMEARHFIFVSSWDAGSYNLVSSPAAHEVGFKAADVMVLKESSVLISRRMAARIVERFGTMYESQVRRKIANALIVKDDAMSLCMGMWLFGSHAVDDSWSVPNVKTETASLWDLRVWCASNRFSEGALDVDILAYYMGQESETVLRPDIAELVRRVDTPKALLNPLLCAKTRMNALSTLTLAWTSDRFVPKVTVPLELALACELIAAHMLDAETCSSRLEDAQSLLMEPFTEENKSLVESNFIRDLYCALWRKTPISMISFLVNKVLTRLDSANEATSERAQILSVIKGLFEEIPDELSGYAALFLVPTLRRIADANANVRVLASELFGQLVRLVPLRSEPPKNLTDPMVLDQWREAGKFLSHFLGDNLGIDGGHARAMAIPEFEIPVDIRADLRHYQKAGINWLAFLAQYGLNGALCDDMGLGKTLQTICVLAASHHSTRGNKPSLVVCPASLVGHWQHEIRTYAPSLGEPLLYAGTASERRRLWPPSVECKVIITSYEAVRSDIIQVGDVYWNYVVLDEGHVIKNPKTKLTQAVKQLRAEHRLVLSGTPIQNNVVELWSLFDFLMPGMLGSESQFMDRFGRAIMAVQPSMNPGSKASSGGGMKEFEEAESKLKALHRQVLPFLLRRMKENVLKELPPKIIQDYECEPSAVQRILFGDIFADMGLRREIAESLGGAEKPSMHVFQALQYLRKICIHPRMVLSDDHPQRERVMEELESSGNKLNDLAVAPKLLLLKELLEECGIGREEEATVDAEPGHRVLIFAQQKSTLDLIEELVLAKHLPHTRYLRLDGSVEQRARFDIAQTFNADPSYEILLLTTQVGGLGLNLTGADTVIFVEHDWNPMRDLQAMDRAHRLGQKRVVTVYRLIVRDTLEQQILGLQRWKTKIAATVVQQQDLTSSGTEKLQPTDLLDLLSVTTGGEEPKTKRPKIDSIDKWLAKHGTMLEADLELDDNEAGGEYDEAFNVDTFVQSIQK